MAFKVILAQQAVEDYKGFDRDVQASLKLEMEVHLSRQPAMVSKSRIKRGQGLRQPQFRLRVGDVRVFYDINPVDHRVEVLRIVRKSQVDAYLKLEGKPNEDTATDSSEG